MNNQDLNQSTQVLSLDSSLFQAIEGKNQTKIMQLLDTMVKATVESDMLLSWLEEILTKQNVNIGTDMHEWLELRFIYWQSNS